MEHTFVILAYGESRYLEECVQSIINQTQKSQVIIGTSTRNKHIERIAEQYHLPIIENPQPGMGLAADFDFGLKTGSTRFVTIAHQDDTYEPEYAEQILKYATEDTIILFTDYHEVHKQGIVRENRNLKVKRLLLRPLECQTLQKVKWIRRRILSMGNPICCPSVTFHTEKVTAPVFVSDFKSNMDWCAWERISKEKGRFVYIKQDLMMHRVHEESTTSEIIRENLRTAEDYRMFCKFWPSWIAKRLAGMYAKSEENNEQ
ncbi:MAG: glycosyltransferase family 2 protein [Lachnospiraceae bacterium]